MADKAENQVVDPAEDIKNETPVEETTKEEKVEEVVDKTTEENGEEEKKDPIEEIDEATPVEEPKEEKKSEEETPGIDTEGTEISPEVLKTVKAELKAEMISQGIAKEKIQYLAIDAEAVMDDGKYDDKKGEKAVKEMLKVLPELKSKGEVVTGFRIGDPEGEETGSGNDDKISEIFGNKKK